jgi:hypothetical protein
MRPTGSMSSISARIRLRRAVGLFTSLVLGLTLVTVVAAPGQAADPCATPNSISCENSKAGNPSSEWEITGDGSDKIDGFTTDISTNVGGTVKFKIHAEADYNLKIYRMGYYGGSGARLITTLTPDQVISKANKPSGCQGVAETGLLSCGTWGVSASWAVPATAVSGIYFAHIERKDNTNEDNHVVFVVRNDSSHSKMIFQTSDTTWQAYNTWGGNSLYSGEPVGRAYAVSYDRPFSTRGTPDGRDFVWANEYPMVRFLEAQGYDVSYQSGVDTDRAGALLLNHRTFLSVGHDEYWSGDQRTNVEAARDAGVNLAFFSGNEVYWKTRYEPSIDGTNTPYRTLVTYKETQADAQIDPTGVWTGTWRDPRFSPPADGGRPENGLTGTIFTVTKGTESIKVPTDDGKMRFWRNTAVGGQAAGQTATLPNGTLGYEWNEDLDNGFRPKGAIELSTANYDVEQKLIDYGSLVAPGNATHHLVLYRASSGALVFGAGTVQWSWGLDGQHDGPATPVDQSMRQATVNLLADMDAQPTTLQSGLVAATRSTDVTAPVAAITSPAAGASLVNGTPITVSGTATDVGGLVGGVEVSLDGGSSWHPATGRGAWSYEGTATGVGTVTVQARATDDSGNVQVAPAQRQVTVACPCVLFSRETPATIASADTSSMELGVRFKAQSDGYVTGVTFYKGGTNTGTHTGSLWTTGGTRLATGTFTGETETGWQTLQFATPVKITADTTYLASYHAPNGGYSATAQYFWGRDAVDYPLTAARTLTGADNGVFLESNSSAFPTSTFKGANYWVSPVFDSSAPPDTSAPQVLSVAPLPAATSVLLTVNPKITFNEPIAAGTLTLELSSVNGLVPGTTTLNDDRTVATFAPSTPLGNGTTYTLSTSGGTDDANNPLAASSSTFRTAEATAPGVCPCSVWSDSDRPATIAVDDHSQVELGVKFKSAQAGFVSGIRFFKGGTNVGPHTGTLWSATGTELATAEFANESSSGWQEVRFSTRVPVTANTTYVASYNTKGNYSADPGGLAADVVNAPLTALSTGSSGGNGLYRYGTRAFPTNSGNGTSYAVDLVFETVIDLNGPSVTGTTPDASANNVLVSTIPTATFSEKIVSGLAVSLKAGTTVVPATVALDAAGRKATITPGAPLLPGTNYTVSLSGGKDSIGNTMAAAYTWNFTTGGVDNCPCTLYPSDRVPAVTSVNDGSELELGVRIKPAVNGFITGARFYKGAGNDGPHVASLWTAAGQLITSAAFKTETESGWQQVAFGSPVAVVKDTAYVVSYSDPTGHYSADAGQFSTNWVNGPLTAPANASGAGNGVYTSSLGQFPRTAYNATGYGVDATFTPIGESTDTRPPGLVSVSPANNASSVPTNQGPVAIFDEPLLATTVRADLSGPGTTVVPATVTIGADNSVTVMPTAVLANNTVYTVRISASDLAGNAMTSPVTWSFRTAKAVSTACPCTLFSDDSAPVVASDSDDRSVEVGVKFNPDAAGKVSGLRFYKGPGNDGTHVGTLWSLSGTELAKVTFTGESAAGWQEATFATPVSVTAGTTYVMSYHANNGGYAYTRDGFANTSVNRGQLNAPMGNADDPNGVYRYGDRGFPTQGESTNYWVDVLYTPGPPVVVPPVATSLTHTTVADFTPGTTSGTYLSPRSDGEITLSPKVSEEFSGTSRPSGWADKPVIRGGKIKVAGGEATINGRLLRTNSRYQTGRQVDVVATLKPAAGQWVGATDDDFSGMLGQWVAFRTTAAEGLVAETDAGLMPTLTTNLPATLLGAPHRYTIDWTASAVVFAVDGVTVATHNRGIAFPLRIAAKDTVNDLNSVVVDSAWLTPYTATGTFTSAVLDAAATVDWKMLTPTATTPAGTAITYQVRTGPTATAGATGWSTWTTVAAGADIPGVQRYLQYRATLTTTNTRNAAPTLSSVQLGYAKP